MSLRVIIPPYAMVSLYVIISPRVIVPPHAIESSHRPSSNPFVSSSDHGRRLDSTPTHTHGNKSASNEHPIRTDSFRCWEAGKHYNPATKQGEPHDYYLLLYIINYLLLLININYH